MDDWYSPSPALLAAIRAAYAAERDAAVPVEFERVWQRIRQDCMAAPDGFARLFGVGDRETMAGDPREVVELCLAMGAVKGLRMERDRWQRWVILGK